MSIPGVYSVGIPPRIGGVLTVYIELTERVFNIGGSVRN